MNAGLHLFQLSYWEFNGSYYCNDVKNIGGKSCKWYVPMRILNLSVEEYIKLLIEKFNAKRLTYYAPTDYLGFCFLKEADVKAFCSFVNKKAKSLNYYCK